MTAHVKCEPESRRATEASPGTVMPQTASNHAFSWCAIASRTITTDFTWSRYAAGSVSAWAQSMTSSLKRWNL